MRIFVRAFTHGCVHARVWLQHGIAKNTFITPMCRFGGHISFLVSFYCTLFRNLCIILFSGMSYKQLLNNIFKHALGSAWLFGQWAKIPRVSLLPFVVGSGFSYGSGLFVFMRSQFRRHTLRERIVWIPATKCSQPFSIVIALLHPATIYTHSSGRWLVIGCIV